MSDLIRRQIHDYIQSQINPYGKPFKGTAYELGLKIMDYIKNMSTVEPVRGEWIPCSERLPENEEEVEISCVRRYIGAGDEKKERHFTARAFYSDGTMTTEDSDFAWNDIDNWEYDEEKDAYIIPEGWWEYVMFSEEFGVVDAEVIAWQPLPEPWKGGAE